MTISVVVVVIVMIVGVGGSCSGDPSDVPHEWFVLRSVTSLRMSKVPASDTIVIEALLVPTEIRPLLHGADAAQCILQIRINLQKRKDQIIKLNIQVHRSRKWAINLVHINKYYLLKRYQVLLEFSC